ncbi:MAG: peptide chain release factor 1, partial [Hyphomicrobiaceae bacterium]|nr:peptide chain release factor 1 [Hyphomicrobiaceae bacterium]
MSSNDRYEKVLARFDQLGEEMGKPENIRDQNKYRELGREYSDLGAAVTAIKEWLDLNSTSIDDEEVIGASDDAELVEMARAELEEIKPRMAELEESIKLLLIPSDPDDSRNTVFEIRAGTGGDEAALFAADLARMYRLYAEGQKWKIEILSSNVTEKGGFKEIIFLITGENAYGNLKFESGVHRVQRVPVTESGGRIHTSAVSVAVLPEAEEVDIGIEANDLKIDVYRSSGPGGQSVNKLNSAVKLEHVPTGITVSMQDEKSQHKNRARAMVVLRARLFDLEQRKQRDAADAIRRSQISTGDRSAKIRT